jgi:hypothetical protein
VVLTLWARQTNGQSTKNVELEAGANYRALTNFPSWKGAYLRAIWKPEARNTLYFELLRQSEFGDSWYLRFRRTVRTSSTMTGTPSRPSGLPAAASFFLRCVWTAR